MLASLFSTVVFTGVSFFARNLASEFSIFVVLIIIRLLLAVPFLVSWQCQRTDMSQLQDSSKQQRCSTRRLWTGISFRVVVALLASLEYVVFMVGKQNDRSPFSFAEKALVDDFQIVRLSLLGFVVFRYVLVKLQQHERGLIY